MILRATFDVHASPQLVTTYLAEPRNHVIANHPRPVIASSDPPTTAGSWAVLALDQIRTRVEYTAFEPSELVEVEVSHAGFGSRGLGWTSVYRLAPSAPGTTVTFETSGSSSPITRLLTQLTWPLTWRQVRRRMERSTSE